MWAEFKWVIENFGNILMLVLCLLLIIGIIVETIARVFPTKDPDSALTRIGLKLGRFGHRLVSMGGLVKNLLDFIKFPNNLKK